jgi:hypothetical protein
MLNGIREHWGTYRSEERRNIIIYLTGISLYRFGLEILNGSIITLSLDRFPSTKTFELLGALTGIHLATQYVGAVIIVGSQLIGLI